MLTASNARTNVVDSTVYETEIALLNLNILSAIGNGSTTANLAATTHTTFNGNLIVGSPMTLASVYYNVWNGSTSNNAVAATMNSVIDNFTKQGYSVVRKSTDGQSITWQISW